LGFSPPALYHSAPRNDFHPQRSTASLSRGGAQRLQPFRLRSAVAAGGHSRGSACCAPLAHKRSELPCQASVLSIVDAASSQSNVTVHYQLLGRLVAVCSKSSQLAALRAQSSSAFVSPSLHSRSTSASGANAYAQNHSGITSPLQVGRHSCRDRHQLNLS